MEQQINEAVEKISTGGKRVKKGNKKPWIVIGVVVAVLAVTYMALCAYANSLDTFYPNSNINFIDVSGLTPEEAQAKLDKEVPAFEVPIYSEEEFYRTYTAEDPLVPLAAATLEALGFNPEAEEQNPAEWVSTLRFLQTAKPFLSKGWDYFQHMLGNRGGAIFCYYLEGDKFEAAVDSIRQQLTVPAVDTGYTLEENTICITRAKDGYCAERDTLKEALSQAGNSSLGVHVPLEIDTAVVLTAQEIYDQVAGEMKNAGYDSETDSIIPEKVGAEFDVKAAQSALDAAAPGETVEIPAVIHFPTVTAAELEAVLFRDVLGEYTTNVSGTTARRNNVKLSASTINNYVMNTGDVFSYNGVVGQRTAANGYQPAPAYVKGETVDEIGGGICQTSSTLYLACLRGNLEITERYAHRYIPAYVPAGMDATVSWGGPDYKFTNDTLYPIRIETVYEGGWLTVRLLGTNVDGIYAKMTNEVLSRTDWETEYVEDEAIAPGAEEVKTTPYTGYKVKSYRHVYDKDGNLLSSAFEADSNYKVRNKVILRAPGELPGQQIPVVAPVVPEIPPEVLPQEGGETAPEEAPELPAEEGDAPDIVVQEPEEDPVAEET